MRTLEKGVTSSKEKKNVLDEECGKTGLITELYVRREKKTVTHTLAVAAVTTQKRNKNNKLER